jgi:hypothetical protein
LLLRRRLGQQDATPQIRADGQSFGGAICSARAFSSFDKTI